MVHASCSSSITKVITNYQWIDGVFIILKIDFSNVSSLLTTYFLLMDMSILTRGPKHVFVDQSI
jgi:hypothetical protein